MKKLLARSLIAILVLLNIYGCAAFIVGGAVGALGAYAVSKDTIQGDTDKPYDTVWNATVRVLKARSTIQKEDMSRGYIEAEDAANRIYIRLIHLTRTTVRLRVSVRKHHLPNIESAQDLFVRIIENAQ